jgi:NAD(P)H-flavin reductase
MTTILRRQLLADNVWRYRLLAPRIARKRRAGQFIILRPTDTSERIPLTIANASEGEGWIEVIFQVVGKGTTLLASLSEGGDVHDLVGPLGQPTLVHQAGHCLCIGGGVGIAPLYPIVAALKAAGNTITTILGARDKGLLILTEEMGSLSDRLVIATDNGSAGLKGFAADALRSLLAQGDHFHQGVVIGPVPMMRATAAVSLAAGIPTVVSLNPIMIDGTGMCGGCRVTVAGQTRFACVDGPEFDAAQVDWDGLMARLSAYRDHERRNLADHACRLDEDARAPGAPERKQVAPGTPEAAS